MNKHLKYFAILFIVGLMTESLFASDDIVTRFRLYEGFKEKTAALTNVAISYHLKTGHSEEVLSKEAIAREKQALIKVYNLKDLKLITRDSLVLKKGEKKGQFQQVVLGDRELKVQLTPIDEKEDIFKLEVLEKDEGKQSMLETEILMPQEKAGSVGFEGAKGRVYYLSFNRLKNKDDSGEKTMHVFFYKRPALIRKVNPEYPQKALDEWIKGTVVLDTEIGTDGNVKSVKVIKGAHPMLEKAAAAAVKKWKYQPFQLKGGLNALVFTVSFRFELIPVPEAPTRRLPTHLKPQLVRRVNPVYPHTALKAHIQGEVLLEVVTDQKGNVKKVTAVSGHPLLEKAAVKAVKQWKYKPYLVDGEPKPVIFYVTIRFKRTNIDFYKKDK